MNTGTVSAGTVLRLPRASGALSPYRVAPRSTVHDFSGPPPVSRQVFAAAHVVTDPLADAEPGSVIDWDATLAFRHHLWELGLGVAEAMDTAQRGAGLTWPLAKELIARSGAEAQQRGAALVCGATTDQLDPNRAQTLRDIIDAYVEQAAWIRQAGGVPVLMTSRHLANAARSAEDYEFVYGAVLEQLDGRALLHWLGAAFDPALRSYWGSSDVDAAAHTVLRIINDHRARISGIKLSLLDARREAELRKRLPDGVRMFTGDDFNYDLLIAGDQHGHSDALLGVFDAIAAPARAALARLDEGDIDGYSRMMAPTVPLARHLFATPTWAYKTGVVFLAWINGHQAHPHMLGGAQTARSVLHICQLFVLADHAGALSDPDLAVARMRTYLSLAGIDA